MPPIKQSSNGQELGDTNSNNRIALGETYKVIVPFAEASALSKKYDRGELRHETATEYLESNTYMWQWQ
jgi:hypothetical protein